MAGSRDGADTGDNPDGDAAVTPVEEVYAYRIEHETWGDIGTLTNRIHRQDDVATVDTRVRILVRFIVVLHREEANRTEVWKGGRLVCYQSDTRINGKRIRVSGQAEDDKFLIRTDGGSVVVPPGVFPNNPWSITIGGARTIMGATLGIVVPVNIEMDPNQTVTMEDRTILTRHFLVSPRADPGAMPFPQEAWFDSNDIPVMFSVIKKGSRITFRMSNYDEILRQRKRSE